MKRFLILLVAVVVGLGLVAGCGSLGEGAESGAEEESPFPDDCDPEDDACWQDDDGDDDGEEEEDGEEEDGEEQDDTDDGEIPDPDDDTDDEEDTVFDTCFPNDSIEELLARFGKDQAVAVSHPMQIVGAWGDAVYELTSDLNLQGVVNNSTYLNGGVTGTVVVYGNGYTIKNYNDSRGLFQAANLILIDVNFSDLQINKNPSDVYSDDGGAVADFCVCLAMQNVSARNISVYLPGGYDTYDVRSVGAIAGRVNSVYFDNVDFENIQARLGSHHDRGYSGGVAGDLINGGFLKDVRLNGFQVSVDSSHSRTFVGSLFGMVGAGEAQSGEYAVWMQDVFVSGGTVTNPSDPGGAYNMVGGLVGSFSSQATLDDVSVQNVDLVYTPSAMLFAGNMAGGAHLSGLQTQGLSLQVTGNGQSGLPQVAFDNDSL